MRNKPLIVTVPSFWADAAAGARAIATIRAAVHRKSFKGLIGLLLSSGSAIECKRPCSAARRQQRRGTGVAAEAGTRAAGRLAGESSAAEFFQCENLLGRPRERRRSSRVLLTPTSASAPAAGSGTIVGMTATNA